MCTLAGKTPCANLKKQDIQTAVFPRTRRDGQLGDGAHAPIPRTITQCERFLAITHVLGLLHTVYTVGVNSIFTCGQTTHRRFRIWTVHRRCDRSSRRAASAKKNCRFSRQTLVLLNKRCMAFVRS